MPTSLQWYFGPAGSDEQGPNDPITTTFKGNRYYSLAREVIQNSLDVADTNTRRPVKVSFSLVEIPLHQIPGFAELATTFRQCAAYYPGDEKFRKFCTTAISLLGKDKITCLKISDYNTLGMAYAESDKSPFYAFMKSTGFNLKASQGAGGSFGYGKGAYYLASQLRTLIVSSVYRERQCVFQGRVRLTTHRDARNDPRDYAGMYGLAAGTPVTGPDLVPELFRRSERGTDIFIMGFHQERDWKDNLIKSVLNNFWLAILEQKLIVEVDDTIVQNTNLEEVIRSFYKETYPDGGIHAPEGWNPYPYYKAVKYDQGPHAKYFQEMLPVLGQVKLWIYLKEGLPNRTVYMRSPRMTVYKKTDNRAADYAAVFLCDSERGNEVLRQMENPQHNEWKKDYYLENDQPHPDGRKAEAEIRSFMNRCLSRLVLTEAGQSQKITGLEEYLNIPEDLLEESTNPGREGRTFDRGNLSTERTPEETAAETTFRQSDQPVTIRVQKRTTLPAWAIGSPQAESENAAFTGPPPEGTNSGNKKDPRPDPGSSSGNNRESAGETGEQAVRQPLQVRYRVIAQTDTDGTIRHVLKILSPREATVDLELYAGLDNDNESNDGLLPILSATKETTSLNLRDNKIRAVSLQPGWNLVTVNFDSNQKHSLKLKSYEV
jgi:hypothetical protein